MKSIEEKYRKKVRIVFYAVFTEVGQHYALKYGIEKIPTQLSLDSKGKVYYIHFGFLPEGELVRVLQMKSIKTDQTNLLLIILLINFLE
jgi:hypothetical protein